MLVIFVILLAFSLGGCTSKPDYAKPDYDYDMSAQDFMNAYLNNPSGAASKYNGHTVHLSGTVVGKHQQSDGSIVLPLYGGREYCVIGIFTGDAKDINNVKDGKSVVIQGTVLGVTPQLPFGPCKNMVTVEIDNCSFVGN